MEGKTRPQLPKQVDGKVEQTSVESGAAALLEYKRK
jgi:hypothetical protein